MAEENFSIRKLKDKDLESWFYLRKRLWDELSDDEHKAEMIDIYGHSETQVVLVAENSGEKIVGFLEAGIRPFVEDCKTDRVGYLEGWFVEENYRRSGIGRKLVRAAEQWARSKDCTEMASDSEIGNDLSFKAHRNLGYEETSRLIHLRKDLV